MKTIKSLSLRQILVLLDFSENTRQALPYAISLADRFGARISLLHLVEPVIYPPELTILPINEKSAAEVFVWQVSILAKNTTS